MERHANISNCLAACVAALAGCASAPPMPSTAEPLAIGRHETFIATLPARGVQIYECRLRAARPAWTLVAPEADLFEPDGRLAGHHGAGPYWEADDGSRVVGIVLARTRAPVADAVAWQLFDTRRSSGAPGRFDRVTRIRRVNTVGGAPPSRGCDAESLGSRARIAYTADYEFFVRQ